MNPERSSSTEREPERANASVVAFPTPAPRRFRRSEDEAAPRGAILLFTGIRYERAPEPAAQAPRLRRRS